MTKQEIHFRAFGYEPLRMKPVHLANGLFLALTGRFHRLELLNKTSVVSHSKGLRGEYEVGPLRERLLTGDSSRIANSINVEKLNSLRIQLNALVSNDDAVYAAFDGYSAFGNDYTLSSSALIVNQKRLDGFAGWFLSQALQRSPAGIQLLELARNWIESGGDPIDLFTKPLQDSGESSENWDNPYEEKFGVWDDLRLDAISSLMRNQTEGLLRSARFTDERESVHARLRNLIIGLGLWLILYTIRESASASGVDPETVFFADFTGDPDSRCRAASRTGFSKHRDLVFRSYEAWHKSGRIEDLKPFEGKQGDYDFKFLEEHFSDLAVRVGFAQPRAFQAKLKHYEPQPDTLRVMIATVLEPDELLPLPDLAARLRESWQLCVGACDDDAELLRQNGIYGLDEDDDLSRNRNAFTALLKRLGLAYEPSDGLVLCGMNVHAEAGI